MAHTRHYYNLCGTVGAPVGSNVKITKSRVLKRMSKNDSALHKVSFMFYFVLCVVVHGHG